MTIRQARNEDAPVIKVLLEQLGYPMDEKLVTDKLAKLLACEDHKLLVYELDRTVVAFISVHFVPQMGLLGDFAIIGYFAVDESARSKGVGYEMEKYVTLLAKERNCDRIQLHCNIRRTDAHRFYERQGYEESRKYYSKRLK